MGHRPGAGGGEVGLGDRGDDAGEAPGGGGRHPTDAGVSHRAADEGHVAQAGDVVVGEVAAPAGEQPGILGAQPGLADHASVLATVSRPVPAARRSAAASRTAATMPA